MSLNVPSFSSYVIVLYEGWTYRCGRETGDYRTTI